MNNTRHFGFVGLGLIGGSIARNLRKLYPDSIITAYYYKKENINPELLLAQKEGTINEIVTSFSEGFSQCDIIFLCAPVVKNISYLPALKKVMKPGCILTDVGSVKGNIHEAIKKEQMEDFFIGGHPMAGSEKTGYASSTLTLLENAFYILTPTVKIPDSYIDTMTNLVKNIGAIPIILPPDEHDRVTAAISHVPHIIASTLVNLVQDYDDPTEHMRALAAGGFKDITRIASSSPIMWENICLTNPDSIISFLEIFIDYINKMIAAIKNNDSDYLLDYFGRSKNYRDSIPGKSVGIIEPVYEIFVDVTDKKGTIATVATILANQDINIKNIGIINNREFSQGALHIEFYENSARTNAISVLESNHYKIFPNT